MRHGGWLLARWLTGLAPLGFAQVRASTVPVSAGSSAVMRLTYQGSEQEAAGLQFDLDLDPALVRWSLVAGDSPRGAGKSLFVRRLGMNRARVVVVGMNRAGIGTGPVADLFLVAPAEGVNRDYAVRLSNAVATDEEGRLLPLASQDGVVSVSAGAEPSRLQIDGVRNAASLISRGVSPGEIVTLLGAGIGPETAQVPAQGGGSQTLGDTLVRFDGIPAPLLYVSLDQVNLVVPHALAGRARTLVEVNRGGRVVASASVPVGAARPALFTLSGGGWGAAAALNENGELNTEENPARRGTIAVLFGTGGGVTNPQGVDGQIASSVLARPVAPVRVFVGGQEGEVLYAGAAPGMIAGLLQVNVRVPVSADPGLAPVTLSVGEERSPAGVLLWIR